MDRHQHLQRRQQPPQYQYQCFDEIQLVKFQLNKLQAYKSSFQAWKCVSFGYALLAIVLLFSKWQEVTTDLKLLTSIDQLIWSNGSLHHDHQLLLATSGATNQTHLLQQQPGNWSAATIASRALTRSWPPLPLELWLSNAASTSITATSSGQNGSSTLVDSSNDSPTPTTSSALDNSSGSSSSGESSESSSSSSMLMSHHMQLVAGRELSGSQLLRQEVELFLAEFRSAKLTLSLSSLLVIVYIISWILMALAVSDARISNDISLRNILLLSVFGAIDMAASFGFVVVRIIMFHVKNSSFVADIIGSSGLPTSSVRLSADQLTAFTALRLIAMRSCSAYIDVYVSVIVALLTTLRLYAIVRAIAYYRFLRRFNDSTRDFHQQQQLEAVTSYATVSNNNTHKALGAPSFDGARHQFSFNSDTGSHLNRPQEPTTGAKIIWQHSRPTSRAGFQYQQQQQQQHPVMDCSGANPDVNMILTTPSGQASAYSPSQYQQKQLTSSMPVFEQQVPRVQSMWRQASTLSPGEPEGFNHEQQQHHHHETGSSKRQCDPSLMSYFVSPKVVDGQQHQQRRHVAIISEREERQEPAPARGANTTTNQCLPPPLQLYTTTTTNISPPPPPPPPPPPHQSTAATTNDMDRRHAPVARHAEPMARTRRANRIQPNDQSAPNLLLVNGRTHRLVTEPSYHASRSTIGYLRGARLATRLIRRDELGDSSASGAGFDSEPVECERGRQSHRRDRRPDELNLLDANNKHNNSGGHKGARKQAALFTLLSASQLERPNRRLMARARTSSGAGDELDSSAAPSIGRTASLGKYRVIARYRPTRGVSRERQPVSGVSKAATQSTERGFQFSAKKEVGVADVGGPKSELGLNRAEPDLSSDDTIGSSSSSQSSSSSGSDDDQLVVDSLEGLARLNVQVSKKSGTASQRSKTTHNKMPAMERSSSGLRQTEEFNLSPMAASRSGREILLEKCKCFTERFNQVLINL